MFFTSLPRAIVAGREICPLRICKIGGRGGQSISPNRLPIHQVGTGFDDNGLIDDARDLETEMARLNFDATATANLRCGRTQHVGGQAAVSCAPASRAIVIINRGTSRGTGEGIRAQTRSVAQKGKICEVQAGGISRIPNTHHAGGNCDARQISTRGKSIVSDVRDGIAEHHVRQPGTSLKRATLNIHHAVRNHHACQPGTDGKRKRPNVRQAVRKNDTCKTGARAKRNRSNTGNAAWNKIIPGQSRWKLNQGRLRFIEQDSA